MKTIVRRLILYADGMRPTQIMVSGFAAIIVIGALLLTLPIASQSGESIGLLNALFTATSAVCVTGLVMVDTATYWSLFGQIVIITLIQIGGLGFMTVATMFSLMARKKIQLRERLLIQESLNQADLSGLVRLTRFVLIITITIEGIGALVLSTVFIPQFGLSKGIWYSVFHAISAFCNAGFDLMGSVSGPFTSLNSYVNNFTVSMTVCALIVLGGLGFPVVLDIVRKRRFSKLNVHSKVVLFSTATLIFVGALFIFLIEFNQKATMADLPLKGKVLSAIFQSVTARTAGFNTLDLATLRESSVFVMIILMFIGASPASTGGGIKTTTLAVLIITVRSFLSGKSDIEAFERRLAPSTIKKSLGIFVISISAVIFGTLIISITQPNFTLVQSTFEVTSALATVGSSLAGTPNLNALGKIIIIIFMFMGRVGSLTLFMAILSGGRRKSQPIRYAEGKIMVG
ncbi:TPA: TrkH family potassium uptake protein [Clostridioides difficile]|uniref:TrkH family potassium uptake protein n=1 Tax=Clostridioides difficile TaxID=1496 RepID=UPI001025FD21|nr:TrkH family potassium uptake protein [Clostridioides difficile]VFG96584.1 cation transport protein, Trk family [Clostridioides difficile]VFH13388.1 cation transport protein, Trk family [Clostridioides difficile]VFH15123.1 cation transport protein, Trk family [Clostridioides difficile]HBG9826943.1 Trk family potassium uptake protein [Clostridioides difficile]HBG9835864.1 Trk family potassium uptake protein [Clostridioides difficile]